MPYTAEEQDAFFNRCYGLSPEQMNDWVYQVEHSLTHDISGKGMVLIGLLSDVQEQIAAEDLQSLEEARQDINRIKHLIDRWYMSERG